MQALFDLFFRPRVFLQKVDIPVAVNPDGLVLKYQPASSGKFLDAFEESELVGHESKRHVVPQPFQFYLGFD